ncbi:MAG: hypothetical protein U1C46_12055 [Bacteroidales bacterium]|nr:hypothetical protein [Bacteroidales bacterium]MDZ4205534.1 hypothetical protein [Bacteroidales bacterium]
MKKTPAICLECVIIFFAVLLATVSCDEDLLTVKVPITKEFNFKIDSIGLKSAEPLLFESQVALNLDSLITAHDGDPDVIKKGNLKSATITILQPPNITFGFINSLRVNVQKPPQAPIDIATAQNSNALARELTFQIEQSQDALGYLKQGGSFFVRLYGNMNSPLPVKEATLKLRLEWEVTVGLI